MKQYKVKTSFIQQGIYTVEAKSEEEAREIFSSDFKKYEDDFDSVYDSQEEVISVEEIKSV